MPLISQPILELPQHVFLPVIQTTCHRILKSLAVARYIGDKIYIKTDFTTHSKTDDDDNNTFSNIQSFRVEANIQMNPYSQKWDFYTFHHTAAYGINVWTLNNHAPIYLDKENSVRIVEMRSPLTIALNCQLNLLTKDYGYAVPNQIFNMYENGCCYSLNDLFYDYPIPKAFLTVLLALWKMDRRKGKSKGVSFPDYIAMHTDNTWQTHINRDIEEEYEVVVPCPVTQILGTLEYNDDKPQAEQENRLAIGFQIPFVYTIQFNSPTIGIMQIPAVYNNQKVPEYLIPMDGNIRQNPLNGSRICYQHENYEAYHNRKIFPMPGHIPVYDEWMVPNWSIQEHYKQRAFYITMIGVDEENNQPIDTVIDLLEPNPQYEIHDLVKEILYQEGPEAVNPDGICTVQLYRNYKPLRPMEDYYFHEDLKVIFKPINLHDQYRVVLSAATDLNYINKKWWWLIDKYWPWFPPSIRDQYSQWYHDNTGKDYNWNLPHRPPNPIGDDRDKDYRIPPGDIIPPNQLENTDPYFGGGSADIHRAWITRYNIIAKRSSYTQTRTSK